MPVHRWLVDAIDGGTARVEVDGQDVLHVPRCLLPSDAREGDVLRVRQARGGSRARLVVERDEAATRMARERAAARVGEIPVAGDGGGDIQL